jgi:hypothetical protein
MDNLRPASAGGFQILARFAVTVWRLDFIPDAHFNIFLIILD